MWVDILGKSQQEFLLITSIFSVESETRTLSEKEVEGGGVECLKREGNV